MIDISQIKIAFGAMAQPIERQLQEQGLTLGITEPKYQRAADSITYLRIHGLLTESAVSSVRKKLIKQIAKDAKVAG